MKYIIDISLAEDSKVVKTIGSTYYMSNGKCDTVTFSARGISIEAERGKAYTEDDIFNNVQNSLYNQMLKALLYHYAVNGAKAAITRIEVTVVTAGRQSLLAARDFVADDQPLPVAAPLMELDSASLELLMDETGAAYDLRLTMVHWLSAMGESNKMTRLEYYDDSRVVKLLLDTIVYMQAELTAIGEYNNIMTCRYAYFLRNRLFHGHSLLKCPIFNRQADMMGVGVTVSTVEPLVAELINNFGRL